MNASASRAVLVRFGGAAPRPGRESERQACGEISTSRRRWCMLIVRGK